MPRSSISLCALALVCAALPAAAQGTAPLAQAPSGGARTCDEAAVRALAAQPGRVSREGGRVSLLPPAGMREVATRGVTTGPPPVLMMEDPGTGAALFLSFAAEVPHVQTRTYQERWTRAIEGTDRRAVRWIQRQVLDVGGHPAYGMEFVKRGQHQVLIVTGFQGRTLMAGFTNTRNDAAVQAEIEKSVATLVVHDCAFAAGSEPPAAVAEVAGGPGASPTAICEEAALQAHLADGDPRRSAIADGRISLIPPDGMRDLTSIEVSRVVRGESRPVRIFTGDSAVVWLRFISGALDVSSPAFLAAMERWVGGQQPERITWISRGVVEQGGARWLRMEYTYPSRRGVEQHALLYTTPFQGRTLAAGFVGPTASREVLAQSAATLEARDCRLTRPLEAWLDSAAVARVAAALEAPQMPADMKPIFRVTFDTTGVVELVEPVFEQMPAAYADAVVAALRAAIKPRPRSRFPTARLVRVVGGPSPLVDSPEVIERVPELRDAQWVGQLLANVRNTLRFRPGASRQAAPGFYVRMRVLPDGKVDRESVRLLRGSDVASVDEQILGIARRVTFRPGEVDGFAARTWIVLPMTLSSR